MNEPSKQTNKKKNKGLGWLVLLLFAFSSGADLLEKKGLDSPGGKLVVGLLFLVVLIVLAAKISKAKKGGSGAASVGKAPAAPAVRRTPEIPLHSPVPSMQRGDSSRFPQPDAYCLVCEQTGEDHFAHDREQRIKQLDEWLKSGLIDRAEYNELKRRYMR
ncbi:MAG: hypothetical protein K6G17_01240 [Oscillospiraceae bacterium]|nr:hypothetical protein [Oscillospiraceae bacterium]